MWPFKKKPERIVTRLRDMIVESEKSGDVRTANILTVAVSDILRLDTTTGRGASVRLPNG